MAANGAGGSRGQLPVHAAAMRGDIAALAWLHAHGESMQAVATDTGQQPTHFAAAARSLDALAWLGSHGGDLTALSHTGQQPLHLAALAGDTATLSWLEEQGVDLGALRQSDGASAAHFASAGGDGDAAAALRTLAWLDQRGQVDLAATTLAGQTALDLWSAGIDEIEKVAAEDEEVAAWWQKQQDRASSADHAQEL